MYCFLSTTPLFKRSLTIPRLLKMSSNHRQFSQSCFFPTPLLTAQSWQHLLLLTTLSLGHLGPAARAATKTSMSVWQVQRAPTSTPATLHHQITWSPTSPISTCLPLWPHEVHLKNFTKYFLHHFHMEREHTRNWWSCRTNKVAGSSSGYQESTLGFGRTGWMQRSMHKTWGKAWISQLLELYEPATKVTPSVRH